ncbi:SHOCT domain-containing protein [Streptacidiphilus sp. EB129]|uniref:SHOCT domain-containing protein n=1 Tax=Streptacidiphilus sp. EB129 TaxID=3156262 RepID=UPI0035178423
MIGRSVGRGRRPGLIGAAARTAVVAGTATAVSGRVAARQQQRAASAAPAPEAPAPAPAAAPAAGVPMDENTLNQLERLSTLYSQNLLSEAEFTAAKQRLLGT